MKKKFEVTATYATWMATLLCRLKIKGKWRIPATSQVFIKTKRLKLVWINRENLMRRSSDAELRYQKIMFQRTKAVCKVLGVTVKIRREG